VTPPDTPTAWAWDLPLSDIIVSDELAAAAREAVASGWWSMGPRVEEFERAFAEFVGSEQAFAVANGTAALHIALLAVGCGSGDEVVVPSLNFVAAANTIVHTGAKPVFCDIVSEDDLTMDPADVEAAITPATKAIVVMHYGGFACHMDAIREIASRNRVAIIEDAAHAPGATWRGQACGTLGAVGCFSFFSNKNLPVGEGGMVVTDDSDLAERIKLLRSHGMTTLTWDRERGHADTYDVVLPGFNYRLDELRAAIGLVQLGRVFDENESRGRILARYREGLDGRQGITIPFRDRDARAASHHLAVAVLDQAIERTAIRAALRDARIQTSVHYPPIHRFSHYASSSTRDLPRTDAIAHRILTLPLYGAMRPEQVDRVVEAVLDAVSHAS
jgi:dTDP-4-amino-4,6-dideoxygalactose transaminase